MSFYALLSLTPLGTFPPPPLTFTVPQMSIRVPFVNIVVLTLPSTSYTLEWVEFIGFMFILTVIVIIGINVLPEEMTLFGTGVGVNIDKRQVSTIIFGLIMAGLIGGTLMGMMPADMPVIISFLLVYPFVGLLAYSVITDVGMG